MHRLIVLMFVGSLAASAFACSAAPTTTAPNGTSRPDADGGGAGAGGDGSEVTVVTGAEVGTKCPMHNQTQACSCDVGGERVPGRQVCYATSGWTECQCESAPDSGTNDPIIIETGSDCPGCKDVRFAWRQTQPTGGSCKAGHYSGGFDGIYIPAITLGFGPIPVFGNVEFELGESSTGEFFEVKDGHMIGAALVAFLFEGDIVGTLDCSGAFFEGALKNCYYIIPGLPEFLFEGVIRADYDKFNHAFVNGVWSVTEIDAFTGTFPEPLEVQPGTPVPFPPPLGGTGTWSNFWVP